MDKKQKINLLIAAISVLLVTFANVYCVKKIMHIGSEVFFYDKMLVAYQIGSDQGLKKELIKMIQREHQSKVERKILQDFKERLPEINDLGKFLNSAVDQRLKSLKNLRLLRSLSFVFVLIFFLIKLFLKPRKPKT